MIGKKSLTEKQKETVEKEFNDIKETEAKLTEKVSELESEQALNKVKKTKLPLDENLVLKISMKLF